MAKKLVGLDIETHDPLLKTAGWSWKYGQGYILCTALAMDGEKEVIAGIHNDNCPYNKEERLAFNQRIVSLLKNPEIIIVGANLQYDIGWLLYEYGMTTYDVKCSFIDVLQAEAILDEFNVHSLDEVSWKYLKYGKKKERIEEWVQANIPHLRPKEDFRKYLKDSPWDLLCEYVLGDAENPLHVWKKQLTLLKQQELVERVKIEFNCILPTLQITINGFPFDNELRKRNLEKLVGYRDQMRQEFEGTYGVKSFKVTSSRQIASLCDRMHIPYKCKITLKGEDGHKFESYIDTDDACRRAKKLVSSFRFVKSVPVAYVPSELAERTVQLLEEQGFMVTCSPNVDKNFFASQRENFPVIDLIANWKLCDGIISKILGDKYERFIGSDGRIHPQFNITNTLSFRYSSNAPNIQQIPSKGGFKLKDGTDVSFPALIRALFKPEKGKVYFKIDYGQIEYRLICNIAVGEGGKEVRAEYARNPRLDYHQYVIDLTGLTRKYAKNMNFGVAFGMGLKSMAESFGWTMEQAEEISTKYHEKMPFVAPTLALVGDVAVERGYIKTVAGSHARLPNPNKKYTMLNRYTQGSGAEIMKCAIIESYRRKLWENFLKFHATIHDELGGSASPTREGMEAVFELQDVMCNTTKLKVPLIADIEIGADWCNVHELAEWRELIEQEADEWTQASDEIKQAVRICLEIEEERKNEQQEQKEESF